MIRAALLLALLLLVACGRAPVREAPPAPESSQDAPSSRGHPHRAGTPHSRLPPRVARPDQPGEYTPGGLYKPGVADSGPRHAPDLSDLVEPVPKVEPLARYGNRSPYTVLGRSYRVMSSAVGYVERGMASWYGEKFHGRATSSLEPYDMYAFSAAHRTLPLPSYVRVTNLENGRDVVVRVNDRGPFHENRIIDLSYAAAVRLGMHERGTARVEVRALVPGQREPQRADAAQQRPAGRAGTHRRDTAAPRTAATPADPGRTWLQVASFGERANARRLADRIEQADLGQVRIERADVGGQRVFRVRVGPWRSRDEAERAAAAVQAHGFGQPSLVTE